MRSWFQVLVQFGADETVTIARCHVIPINSDLSGYQSLEKKPRVESVYHCPTVEQKKDLTRND